MISRERMVCVSTSRDRGSQVAEINSSTTWTSTTSLVSSLVGEEGAAEVASTLTRVAVVADSITSITSRDRNPFQTCLATQT